MDKLSNENIVENRSDPIWFQDPKILVIKGRVAEFFPNEEMSTVEKLNALMRMTIYMGVLLAVLCRNYLYLYIPVVCGGLTWAIYSVQMQGSDDDKERLYTTSKGILKGGDGIGCHADFEEDCEHVGKCVTPTVDNPFMNYNKITSERDRAPACVTYDKPDLKKKIESNFNINLYRDVGDLYGKKNSQREYYTTPGSMFTGGVGDQTSFAKWCYNAPPTCKEDGLQCTGNYTPELYSQTPIVNR